MPIGITDGGAYLEPDLWNITVQEHRKELVSEIDRAQPLLSKVMRSGRFGANKTMGGMRGTQTFLARADHSYQYFETWDDVDWAGGNYTEKIDWDTKKIAKNFVISEMDMKANESAEHIANFYEIKLKALMQGFTDIFAHEVYGSGTNLIDADAPKNRPGFSGLQYMTCVNPYAPGLKVYQLMRGGNPGDLYEFWRNWAAELTEVEATATSLDIPYYNTSASAHERGEMLYNAWDLLLSRCMTVTNGSKVDGIYTNVGYFDLIRNYINKNIEQVNNQKDYYTDSFFKIYIHNGHPVYLDWNCPTDRAYFEVSRTFEVIARSGYNFSAKKHILPNKFDAIGHVMRFAGNMVGTRARCNGVFYITPETVVTDGVKGTTGLPPRANCASPAMTTNFNYLQPAASIYTPLSDTLIENVGYSASSTFRDPAIYGAVNPETGGAVGNQGTRTTKYSTDAYGNPIVVKTAPDGQTVVNDPLVRHTTADAGMPTMDQSDIKNVNNTYGSIFQGVDPIDLNKINEEGTQAEDILKSKGVKDAPETKDTVFNKPK